MESEEEGIVCFGSSMEGNFRMLSVKENFGIIVSRVLN